MLCASMNLTPIELKARVVETGLDKEFAKAKNKIFRSDDHSDMEELEAVYGQDLLRIANNIVSAKSKRKCRIKSKIDRFCVGKRSIFATITFTDAVLASTTEEQRRRYVRRYLKRYADVYVANIDYGSKNEREHYHAFIFCLDPKGLDLKKWKYGSIDVERVRPAANGSERMSKYISKLTNHALKDHGKMPRMIFSRHPLKTKEQLNEWREICAYVDYWKLPF